MSTEIKKKAPPPPPQKKLPPKPPKLFPSRDLYYQFLSKAQPSPYTTKAATGVPRSCLDI